MSDSFSLSQNGSVQQTSDISGSLMLHTSADFMQSPDDLSKTLVAFSNGYRSDDKDYSSKDDSNKCVAMHHQLILEEPLGNSTVIVDSLGSDTDFHDKKVESEVVLKILNENVLELDMIKFMSANSDIITSNDNVKQDLYNTIPKSQNRHLIQSVQLKLVDSDGNPSSEVLPVASDVVRLATENTSLVWTYCGLPQHPGAESGGRDNCGAVQDRTLKQSTSVTIRTTEHRKPKLELGTRKFELLPPVSEAKSSLCATNKSSVFSYEDINDRCSIGYDNIGSSFEDEDVKRTTTRLGPYADKTEQGNLLVDSTNLQEYRKCSVCNTEVVESFDEHLMEHSKWELVSALSMLTVSLYRPITPAKQHHIKQKLRRNCSPSDVLPASEPVSNSSIVRSKILKTETFTLINENLRSNVSHSIIQTKQEKRQSNSVLSKISTFPFRGSLTKPLKSVIAKTSGKTCSSVSKSNITTKKVRCGWSSRAPHACPVCGKLFSNRGNVAKHMTIHSDLKPWNCASCNIGFNSQRACDHHYLQNHSKERSHSCPICCKTFAVLNNLKEHMLFHGEKKKSCDICHKLFSTQKCVTRHRKRHFPDMKHQCSLCPKSFAIKWDYTLHCRKVHGSVQIDV